MNFPANNYYADGMHVTVNSQDNMVTRGMDPKPLVIDFCKPNCIYWKEKLERCEAKLAIVIKTNPTKSCMYPMRDWVTCIEACVSAKSPNQLPQSHTTYDAILYVSYHDLLLCRPNRKYTTCSKARSRTSLKQSEQLAITPKTSKGSEDWLVGGATAGIVVVNGERLSELRGSGSRRQRLTKTLNLNDSIRKLIVHTMLESQTLHILSPPKSYLSTYIIQQTPLSCLRTHQCTMSLHAI